MVVVESELAAERVSKEQYARVQYVIESVVYQPDNHFDHLQNPQYVYAQFKREIITTEWMEDEELSQDHMAKSKSQPRSVRSW